MYITEQKKELLSMKYIYLAILTFSFSAILNVDGFLNIFDVLLLVNNILKEHYIVFLCLD